MARYPCFCLFVLAFIYIPQARACSVDGRAKECEVEDVRFLSARLDEKPVSYRNVFPVAVDPGYQGYYKLNSFKTNGGAVIMLGAFFEDGGLDFTIDRGIPTPDQKWHLRIDAEPNYFTFSRHDDGCGVWRGKYLQVGAEEFADMGSLQFNETAELVDEILAEYWNRGISRENARAEVLKTNLPEFVSAIDKLDLVRKSEGSVVHVNDFLISGIVQPARVAFPQDIQKAAASFELNGSVVLKKRKVCVDGINRIFPKKLSLYKKLIRKIKDSYSAYKKNREAPPFE